MNPISYRPILKFQSGRFCALNDQLGCESPLEIILCHNEDGREVFTPISVTMRSPGADQYLVAGFLFTEGILNRSEDIVGMEPHIITRLDGSTSDQMIVTLSKDKVFHPEQLKRNFYVNSSCGVCGKSSLDQFCSDFPFVLVPNKPILQPEGILSLVEEVAKIPTNYQKTGGNHVVYLLNDKLHVIDIQEDVGRHNALDKMIGKMWLEGRLPLSDHGILLSGRISFELVQKSLRAGIPVILAFGAASDGALKLAETHGMTLVGFLRKDAFNVYSDDSRVGKV